MAPPVVSYCVSVVGAPSCVVPVHRGTLISLSDAERTKAPRWSPHGDAQKRGDVVAWRMHPNMARHHVSEGLAQSWRSYAVVCRVRRFGPTNAWSKNAELPHVAHLETFQASQRLPAIDDGAHPR